MGKKIRDQRERKGYTQAQLAERVGVTREHISHIEHGKNWAAVNIITGIAEALDVDFEIEGCRIEKASRATVGGRLTLVAHQLSLNFDIERRDAATFLTLSRKEGESIEVEAFFGGERTA